MVEMLAMTMLLLGDNSILGLGDFANEETEADRGKVIYPTLSCYSDT